MSGFVPTVSAEELEVYPDCTRKINGENYYGGTVALKKGSTNKLSIHDVSYNGEMVPADQITYQWYSGLDENNIIDGEISSEYQYIYDGGDGCFCIVTVKLSDGTEQSDYFYFL